jgi:hypothetical protein
MLNERIPTNTEQKIAEFLGRSPLTPLTYSDIRMAGDGRGFGPDILSSIVQAGDQVPRCGYLVRADGLHPSSPPRGALPGPRDRRYNGAG